MYIVVEWLSKMINNANQDYIALSKCLWKQWDKCYSSQLISAQSVKVMWIKPVGSQVLSQTVIKIQQKSDSELGLRVTIPSGVVLLVFISAIEALLPAIVATLILVLLLVIRTTIDLRLLTFKSLLFVIRLKGLSLFSPFNLDLPVIERTLAVHLLNSQLSVLVSRKINVRKPSRNTWCVVLYYMDRNYSTKPRKNLAQGILISTSRYTSNIHIAVLVLRIRRVITLVRLVILLYKILGPFDVQNWHLAWFVLNILMLDVINWGWWRSQHDFKLSCWLWDVPLQLDISGTTSIITNELIMVLLN